MQISSRAVMFWGCRWVTQTFNSLQRFSMGLRSGDWLGHSMTLKCFLRSHSFVAWVVCLGSLSCWKTQPLFIFNALADGRRFSLKISRYMAPFILSFTQISRPGPFAEKQPQSMMFPPPCFTVGMVFFGCNSAFFLLQTRQVEFLPKSSILVSSDHMTFSQSSFGSSKCSLANFRRAWTCTGLSRGTRLALQDLSPWRCSVLLMVAFWRFSTAWYDTVRFTFGGFSTGNCTWYFFSTTSAEVPSDPYRYQNVTCKLCWSLIGRRESSLLHQWTCDMRPARFKSAQPAKERTQLLF